MPTSYRFSQVDVFSEAPLLGNPLAVVHDAGTLSESAMVRLARWTNLSETTFLLPPTHADADYRVRIHTPVGELPFAGHPTLGSCHAWLAAGGQPKRRDLVIQECGVGLVEIRVDGPRLAFAAPPLRRSDRVDGPLRERIVSALGLGSEQVVEIRWIDNGPPWIGVLLRDAQAVLSLKPDLAALQGQAVGVAGAYPAGSDCAFEVRGFARGGYEDPVTGSLNAGLAIWLIDAGIAPTQYVAAQGTVMHRQGRIHVQRIDQRIWIGGQVTPIVSGTIEL
ncbi:MAG: PhzF family phenazine biosynthesis protein [Burkholderiaceae bacterium]